VRAGAGVTVRRILTLAIVSVAVTVAGMLAHQPPAEDNHPSPECVETYVHTDVGDLTCGDMSAALDRVIDPPNVVGWVRGTVVSDARQTDPEIGRYLDYAFRVTGYFGVDNPGYRNGKTITLRTQGDYVFRSDTGCDLVYHDDSGPVVHRGATLYATLYAIVFGPKALAECGGNTADRVCVFDRGFDVFELHGDTVRGQGKYRHFSEPEARFIRHFDRER